MRNTLQGVTYALLLLDCLNEVAVGDHYPMTMFCSIDFINQNRITPN